jgi:hypothetical protein
MQNFSLLKRAGRAKKPVMLKRGMSATLEEFFMAAEYIMSEGNYNVVLCERGVRTFADHTRNTLDLSIVPAVQRLSHLPIVVDPSHGTGKRNKVTPLSRASVAVGADGLIVEVHNQPDKALSDGMQSLYPEQFIRLMHELRAITQAIGRAIAPSPGTAALSMLGSGCYAETGVEPAYVETSAPPVNVDVAPQYSYEGRAIQSANLGRGLLRNRHWYNRALGWVVVLVLLGASVGVGLWRLRDTAGRVQSCELRDDSRAGAGWDVMRPEKR